MTTLKGGLRAAGLVWVLLAVAAAGQAPVAYVEPDLGPKLFDVAKLKLPVDARRELALALATHVRNNLDLTQAADVAMAAKCLGLALRLDPECKSAAVANAQLRDGKKPAAQADKTVTPKALAEALAAGAGQCVKADSPEDSRLAVYLYALALQFKPDDEDLIFESEKLRNAGLKADWSWVKAPQAARPTPTATPAPAAGASSKPATTGPAAAATPKPGEAKAQPLARKQAALRGLMVRTMADGQLQGQAMEIIATVAPGSGRGSTTFKFAQPVGTEMNTAFKEAVRTIQTRYPVWEPGEITFSFEEKYSPKDGGSAGTAFGLLLLSLLEGHELDPAVAITGDITVDGKVRKIGGVGAKIRGALLDKCKLVAIPAENEEQLNDVALLFPVETLANVQVFGVGTLDEALAVARTDRSSQLARAITQFGAFQAKLQAVPTAAPRSAPAGPTPTPGTLGGGLVIADRPRDTTPVAAGPAFLYTPEARQQLEAVLALAPNHLSAKYLLLISNRKLPATLSLTASLNEAILAISPILDVVWSSAPPTRETLSVQAVNLAKSRLDKLMPLIHPDIKPLAANLRGLVSASDSVAILGLAPDTEKKTTGYMQRWNAAVDTVNNRRQAIVDAFTKLKADRKTMEKMLREGY